MSDLKENFERLMDFAKQNNFRKPFSKVYFVEDKSVQPASEADDVKETSRQEIFSFENYENRFDEILKQGYSWINMNFAGMLDDDLLVVIELPNYENSNELTSLNLSLPAKKVLDNDWNASPFYKIAA